MLTWQLEKWWTRWLISFLVKPIKIQLLSEYWTPKIWVVSIGFFHEFYVISIPLEYVPFIPPHSAYVLVNGFNWFRINFAALLSPAPTNACCKKWYTSILLFSLPFLLKTQDSLLAYLLVHAKLCYNRIISHGGYVKKAQTYSCISIYVYHFCLHVVHFCSTWMTSCMQFEK